VFAAIVAGSVAVPPKLIAPVRRRNSGRGHSYQDANGAAVPGVTTILGNGIPKPALVKWSADTTINYAVDNWAELGELPVSERIKRLSGARFKDRDNAARRGTEVHGYGERLVAGESVTPPDELLGHVEAYAQFLDAWDVQPLYTESTVISYRYAYAGTFDLVASLRHPTNPVTRVTWLLDIKTSRSGVFGEHALQLAAYRFADVLLDRSGDEQPMPLIDRCGVVHVRSDGAELIPVTADLLQYRTFLYSQQIAQFVETSRDLVGEPLIAPEAAA
jgi:hypothetical protein